MIAFIVFLGAFLLGLLYWKLFNRITLIWLRAIAAFRHSPPQNAEGASHISIVIAYRNESGRLADLCSSLRRLTYPAHLIEIIWVDDHSEDHSADLIGELMHDALIEQQFLTSPIPGKKAALQNGVTHAKYDLILFTDADVQLPERWIESMLPALLPERIAVCGPVKFTADDTFFKRWIQMDFAALISTGAAYLMAGTPVMANGANLLIRRQHYLQAQTTMQGADYASGDDVFLVFTLNQMAPGSVTFCFHPDATVLTRGPENFQELLQQRIRWASKAKGYKNPESVFLSLFVFVFHLSTFLAFMLSFRFDLFVPAFLVLFGWKLFTDHKFFSGILPFHQITYSFGLLLKSEFMQLLYISLVGIMAPWYRVNWKGRKI